MNIGNMEEQGIELLQKYLKINTVNPPGDTREAIKFFSGIFDNAGIPYRVFAPDKNKPSIMAKIEGNGNKKPVILLNHLDTVTFEEDKWHVPPLDGILKDGYLYGRGAIDMKCVGIFQLSAFLFIANKKEQPQRTIYFLATSDEEIGGKLGAQWISENVPEILQAEAVLNEGFPLLTQENQKPDHICIDVSEKVLFAIKLTARGTPGHASIPTSDNPNVRILNAVYKILSWTPPANIPDSVKTYLKTLETVRYVGDKENDGRIKALTNNTLSLTVLKGGDLESTNVIPSISEAVFDIRLLPGTDKNEFLEEIKSVINDNEITIEIVTESESTPVSSSKSEIYRTIEEVYNEEFPGIPVTPYMVTFVTDSRFFRAKGIDSYGFQPMIIDENEYRGMHGHNERISLDNIRLGVKLTCRLLEKL